MVSVNVNARRAFRRGLRGAAWLCILLLAGVTASGQSPVPDTTVPDVRITSPAQDGTVSGTVSVEVEASDASGVAGITLEVDGATVGAEDTAAPWILTWNADSSGIGSHILTVVARDTVGNAVRSAVLPVVVGFSTPPAFPPPTSHALSATADSLTSAGRVPVAFTGTALLANDSDPQGHAVYVSFVAASSSGGGTIASHGGDAYTYTPAAGFTGTDTFIYSIADDFGGTATTTVSVEVTAPAPVPTSCTAAPALPTGLVASVSGRTVTLNWTAPAGPAWDAPTSYRFEAGLTPTSTLQTLDTGGAATTFVQVSQVDGTFYARVRGVNACGTGAASNTVPVVVGAAAPATVAVPAVAGLTQQAAQAAIAGAGLAVGAVSQANSGTVPAGLVISSSPAAGASVSPGSAVALVVSTGPTLVPVPNVVGLTQAAATTAISAAGYVVGGITQANSATVPAGSVISSNPAAGATIAAGSPVALVVSLGPAAPQGCTAAPLAPSGLAASVSGRTLTLNWAAPSGPAANAPTSYLFEAGLTATSTLQTLGTGSAATSFTQVSQVGGTFYVRVRGRNACGTGPVSNTVQVTLQ